MRPVSGYRDQTFGEASSSIARVAGQSWLSTAAWAGAEVGTSQARTRCSLYPDDEDVGNCQLCEL